MAGKRKNFSMPVGVGKIVVKVVYGVVLGIIFVTGIAILVPRYQNYRMLSVKRTELEQNNQAQEQLLAKTIHKQTRFRDDPEFVEQIARQNKRVRPGEITFIFDFDMPAE